MFRISGILSAWSEWSQCSRSCGPGQRFQTRSCVTGTNCIGPRRQRAPCNEGKCPGGVDGRHDYRTITITRSSYLPELSDWNSWSACDVTCGSGSRLRTRSCGGDSPDACDATLSQSEACSRSKCITPGKLESVAASKMEISIRVGRSLILSGGGQ